MFCRTKCVSEDGWGSLSGGRCRNTLVCTGIMVGSAANWNCPFRLIFHNLNFQHLKEVSHESFIFPFAAFTFWGTSRTKASFSHLQLSLLEGCLARKLRFDIFNCHFWGKSPTKASFSYLQLSDFEGRLTSVFSHLLPSDFKGNLARKLRFHIWSLSVGFWRKSRIVMAASRLLGAAAACIILWSFAAGHCKSYWSSCIKAALVICQQNFLILALVIFFLKFLLKTFSKSYLFCFGIKIRFSSCNLCSRWGKFSCVLQLSLCRSQWNGCVKVLCCCGHVRNTIVFCSWTL